MGFNPPVPQQDSNWEIRAAVLLSLFFQVLLIFLGPTRKRSSAPLFRLTVWSCYLLADWVADLTLGLLLNNVSTSTTGAGSSNNNNNNAAAGSSSGPGIFAFWTPFLLLHLGGPDTITAYSVEDNELWNRHLIGLLFELFSAFVIIFCSLRNNPLVPATMLMLVAGVIKYGERTYSLYYGNVENLRDSMLGPPDPGPNYAKLMMEFGSKKKAGLVAVVEIDKGNDKAEEYKAEEMEKQKIKRLALDRNKSVEAWAYEFFLVFRRLLFDPIVSFKKRRLSHAFFGERKQMTAREAFEVVEVELSFMYDLVYTKAPVAYSRAGWVLRPVCSGCLVSALIIFFHHDKGGMQPIDVRVTYALLLGGLALDAAALLMLLFSDRGTVFLDESRRLRWLARRRRPSLRQRWSGMVSQLNLIRYCLEKPGHYSSNNRGGKWWLKIVKMLGIEEIVDDLLFIRRVPLLSNNKQPQAGSNSHLLDFLFDGLKPAVAQEPPFKKDIMEMYSSRGKGVIEKYLGKNKIEAEVVEKFNLILDSVAQQPTFKEDIMEKYSSRGKGVIKSHEDEIKRVKGTTDGDGVVKSHEDEIKRVKGTTDGDGRYKVILDSVEKSDFDESLLLWHIATDLCRCRDEEIIMPAAAGDARETVLVTPMGPPTQKTVEMQAIGETLSEYMLYLLIKQPDMLAATAGIGLLRYRDTCAEARRFFGSMEAWIDGPDDARRMLLSQNTSEKPSVVKGDDSKSVLFDAVILAKALQELEDKVLMWEVVTGVWREMLTYAALRARGTAHVRSLNRGGDLITFVWLLMQHMGFSDVYETSEGGSKARLIVHY